MDRVVYCLTVTSSDRIEWMDWVLHNFNKQTYPHKELVVVTDSPQIWPESVISVYCDGNVPEKRNAALCTISEGLGTWMDDDDWQHPQKCEWVANHVHKNTVFGSQYSYFMNLFTGLGKMYGPATFPIFNSLGFNIEEADEFDEDMDKGSDTPWLLQMVKQKQRVFSAAPDFYWISHTKNISNPVGEIKANDRIEFGIEDYEWQLLKKLEQRLQKDLANTK